MTVINDQTNLGYRSNTRKRRCQQIDETQVSKRGRYINLPQEQYINQHCNGFTTPKSRHFYVNQTPFTPTQDAAIKKLFTEHPIISSTPKRTQPETIWRPWLTNSLEIKSTVTSECFDRVEHISSQHCAQTTPQQVPKRNGHINCQKRNHTNRSPVGFYDNYFREHQKMIEKNSKVSNSRTAVQVPTGFEHFKQPVKLMWPASKVRDYMFYEGQRFLDAFPVQATIGFYNDTDSDSGTSSPNPLQNDFNLPTIVN